MSNVTVDIRVDLVLDHGVEELDETDVAARIAAGDTTSLRDARALDGRLRIGDAEILDELVPVVQVLCFNAVIALITDGVVFDYSYFSSNESAQLRTDGDTIVLSGSDLPETTFARRDLLRALYACGARWIATLDQLGRAPEANHLRPFAKAASAAVAAAGLA